ncbi:MAG: secretion system protein E, partial [Methanomicrobiales archaeon]|nr:secretion system protein E [Methanomicrobiales archaeon]
MKTDEDGEREWIATIRNLLIQSRGREEGSEGAAPPLPGDQPGEGEVREEVVPGNRGQPDLVPEPEPGGTGIRAFIDSVIGTGGVGGWRASGDGDPPGEHPERIEDSGVEEGEMDAPLLTGAVEDPVDPPVERRDPFDFLKGWKG